MNKSQTDKAFRERRNLFMILAGFWVVLILIFIGG